MFDDQTDGVVIGDGRCGLRLSRAGPANEVGIPTLIEVRAGPFAGAVLDGTVGGFVAFLGQLERLHHRLTGEASLGSYEGFELSLRALSLGQIDVSVEVVGQRVRPISLCFGFELDQTFLPPIIHGLRREFC